MNVRSSAGTAFLYTNMYNKPLIQLNNIQLLGSYLHDNNRYIFAKMSVYNISENISILS